MNQVIIDSCIYNQWSVLDLLSARLTKRHMGHVPQALFRTKQNRPKIGPELKDYAQKIGPDA